MSGRSGRRYRITLYRWLRRAVEMGLLRRDGRGKGREPFRYRLPEAEERWRKDRLDWLQMPELLDPPRPWQLPPGNDSAAPGPRSVRAIRLSRPRLPGYNDARAEGAAVAGKLN